MKQMTALLTLATTTLVLAQVERGITSVTIAGKQISVEYGRPLLKGRDMLGRASTGMVWRTGADQAATLNAAADLVFGSVSVPKGRYSLFTKKVGSDQWELLVNSKTGIWGTNHDPKQDLASIPLQTLANDSSVEKFTIALNPDGTDACDLVLSWGDRSLRTAFKVK